MRTFKSSRMKLWRRLYFPIHFFMSRSSATDATISAALSCCQERTYYHQGDIHQNRRRTSSKNNSDFNPMQKKEYPGGPVNNSKDYQDPQLHTDSNSRNSTSSGLLQYKVIRMQGDYCQVVPMKDVDLVEQEEKKKDNTPQSKKKSELLLLPDIAPGDILQIPKSFLQLSEAEQHVMLAAWKKKGDPRIRNPNAGPAPLYSTRQQGSNVHMVQRNASFYRKLAPPAKGSPIQQLLSDVRQRQSPEQSSSASPFPCPHYAECPYCPWQHLHPISASLVFKQEHLERKLINVLHGGGEVKEGKNNGRVAEDIFLFPSSATTENSQEESNPNEKDGKGEKRRNKNTSPEEEQVNRREEPIKILSPYSVMQNAIPTADVKEMSVYFGLDLAGQKAIGVPLRHWNTSRHDTKKDIVGMPSGEKGDGKSRPMLVHRIPQCLVLPPVVQRIIQKVEAWWCQHPELEAFSKEFHSRRRSHVSATGGTLRALTFLWSPRTHSINVLLVVTGTHAGGRSDRAVCHALRNESDSVGVVSKLESSFVQSVLSAAAYPLLEGQVTIELEHRTQRRKLFSESQRGQLSPDVEKYVAPVQYSVLYGANYLKDKLDVFWIGDGTIRSVPVLSTRRRRSTDSFGRFHRGLEAILTMSLNLCASAISVCSPQEDGNLTRVDRGLRGRGKSGRGEKASLGNVLVLPCGTGPFVFTFQRVSNLVVGVDANLSLINIAKEQQKYQQQWHPPAVENNEDEQKEDENRQQQMDQEIKMNQRNQIEFTSPNRIRSVLASYGILHIEEIKQQEAEVMMKMNKRSFDVDEGNGIDFLIYHPSTSWKKRNHSSSFQRNKNATTKNENNQNHNRYSSSSSNNGNNSPVADKDAAMVQPCQYILRNYRPRFILLVLSSAAIEEDLQMHLETVNALAAENQAEEAEDDDDDHDDIIFNHEKAAAAHQQNNNNNNRNGKYQSSRGRGRSEQPEERGSEFDQQRRKRTERRKYYSIHEVVLIDEDPFSSHFTALLLLKRCQKERSHRFSPHPPIAKKKTPKNVFGNTSPTSFAI